MNELPDQLLVLQTLQGDIVSFEILCKRYYVPLKAVAYAILMDRHLAEDAAQETLAVACRSLGTLRKPEKAGPWLGRICRNVARDMLRQRGRQELLRKAAPVKSGEVETSDDDLVHHAIERLPIKHREVIVMRYFDNMSYERMGQVLGLSQPAVNGRLRRAKKKIETFLIQEGFRSDVS